MIWIFYTKDDLYGASKEYAQYECKKPQRTTIWRKLNQLLEQDEVQGVGYMTQSEWMKAQTIERIQNLK